ncbi:hypothetical protein Tco_0618641 [Tanacetum coccineum]
MRCLFLVLLPVKGVCFGGLAAARKGCVFAAFMAAIECVGSGFLAPAEGAFGCDSPRRARLVVSHLEGAYGFRSAAVPRFGSTATDKGLMKNEEEEHPDHVDFAVVALPAADQAPSAEETEPFKTDESVATPPPHPAYRVTARCFSSSSTYTSMIPLPPLPPIPSPSLPVSSPVPVLSPSPPASPIRPLGYRAAMIRLRAEAASTSHSLPLPPPIILSHTRPAAPSSGTPPLHLLSTDRREDRPEVMYRSWSLYEVGESSSAAAARPAGEVLGLQTYGFWLPTRDRENQAVVPVSTDTELGRHMRAFETRVRQDTDEIYTRLDDEQSGRQLLASRLNMLFSDRRAHPHTVRLMEIEARMSR